MRIDILTLFPQMFQSVLGSSILKRACETVVHPDDPSRQRPPVVSYHLHDIRSYSTDKHQKVDRPPYGGGPGMVIQCQPVWDAVQAVEALVSEPALRIFLSPEGRRLDQTLVEKLAGEQRLLLIVGHYEGIDQRVVDRLAPRPHAQRDAGQRHGHGQELAHGQPVEGDEPELRVGPTHEFDREAEYRVKQQEQTRYHTTTTRPA